MKTTLLCLLSVLLLTIQFPAQADVSVEGGYLDCGLWMKARQQNHAQPFESYALGYLDGISVGEDREFWRVGAQVRTREAVYLWMDNYCRSNPFSPVVTGLLKLFNERIERNKK